MYPCILFALRRESAAFLRRFAVRVPIPAAPLPAWTCGRSLSRVVVLETGAGAERAEAALRWLTGTYLREQGLLHPLCVIAAGFAGALADGWHTADVLLVETIVDARGQYATAAPLELGLSSNGPWRRGKLLTARGLIASPRRKRRVGQRSGAVAVDMESARLARCCWEQGIPFLSVRSISDDVETRLAPQLVRLLGGSRVSIPRVVGALLRSPRLAGQLWRLARNTRAASRSLAEALEVLLRLQETAGPVERRGASN